MWAPVGPHECTFSATVSESIFNAVFMTFRLARGTPNGHPPSRGATSGSVGIVHLSVLEEVIMWVSAHFTVYKLCAAP